MSDFGRIFKAYDIRGRTDIGELDAGGARGIGAAFAAFVGGAVFVRVVLVFLFVAFRLLQVLVEVEIPQHAPHAVGERAASRTATRSRRTVSEMSSSLFLASSSVLCRGQRNARAGTANLTQKAQPTLSHTYP